MRIVFLFTVLALGLWYASYAFIDLSFLTRSGRLGPGFFPRIIGTGIVGFTILSIITELRDKRVHIGSGFIGLRGEVAMIMVMGVSYLVALRVLGGVLATVMFLFVSLSLFNRGKQVQNAVISVLVPGAIYVLFDTLLNAAMPRSMVPLPF